MVVGSMGGTPKHPAWVHNLRAAPDTEVELRRASAARCRARSPTRRSARGCGRGWSSATPRSPTYQARTEREIPVVILSPRG